MVALNIFEVPHRIEVIVTLLPFVEGDPTKTYHIEAPTLIRWEIQNKVNRFSNLEDYLHRIAEKTFELSTDPDNAMEWEIYNSGTLKYRSFAIGDVVTITLDGNIDDGTGHTFVAILGPSSRGWMITDDTSQAYEMCKTLEAIPYWSRAAFIENLPLK